MEQVSPYERTYLGEAKLETHRIENEAAVINLPLKKAYAFPWTLLFTGESSPCNGFGVHTTCPIVAHGLGVAASPSNPWILPTVATLHKITSHEPEEPWDL